MRRTLVLAAGALLAALGLAACGAKTDPITPQASQATPISLELDAQPNADHVGIYEGLANGDFRQAGIDLQIDVPTAPTAPTDPLELLESGKVDVAISSEPQLMLARNQGATLIAIGAIVQHPLSSIIALGSKHITSAAHLKGKTVGTAGTPLQRAYLQTILSHAHVKATSVKQVDVGADLVSAMTSGRVDATLGGFSNDQAIQLRQAHKKPEVIPINRAGVPIYDELVLVTTETFFAKHDSELRRFVQAMGRGYQAVRADPGAGIQALDGANPSLDPTLQAAAVKASLAGFFPSGDEPWGWQNQTQWNAYGKWMVSQHLIGVPAYAAASINQLLAGQGP